VTVEEAIAVVAKVSMGKHRPSISVKAESAFSGHLMLKYSMGPLVNADTGQDDGTYIYRVDHFDEATTRSMGEGALLHVVLIGVKKMMTHEAEEHFRVNGQRIVDPHKAKKR
jgi:hypothetical protein